MTELPHIRYLLVVNEVFHHRRISLASETVHVSQPAATQALARVENILGAQLFERRPNGMYPTNIGVMFKKRLDKILEHLRLGDELARKKAVRNGHEIPRNGFFKFCSPVQFRALMAVEKAGSFTQGASELGVSQPGVHRAVRELGKISGLMLFDQTRRGVVLSAAAQAFSHQLRLAVSEFRQAVYEINETLGRDVTRIIVGSMPLSRTYVLPAAINEMLGQAGAAVQINCIDGRYHALLKDLRFGELDFLIGALRFPLSSSDIKQEELFVDRLAVVASPTHPLAQRKSVTLQDTLEFPWIASPKDTPSGTYLFQRLGIENMANTPVRIVSSSLVLLRELLLLGDYISIVSKGQAEAEKKNGTLVELPIDLPGSERPIGLTFRANWTPTPNQKRFLDIIRNEVSATLYQ